MTLTFTHEFGHILGGWMTGATLRQAELRPWKMPYSLFEPNPHPLITLWSGPILGIVAPVLLATWVRRRWMWFVAHFCLLANGSYLAVAWFTGDRFLDTSKLLDLGAHPASIAAYCIGTIGFGYMGFRTECVRILEPSHGESKDANQVDSEDRM